MTSIQEFGDSFVKNIKRVNHSGGGGDASKMRGIKCKHTDKQKVRKTKFKRFSTCLFPGCTAPLPKANKSMVYKDHLHDCEFCQCKRCLPRGPK